MATSDTNPNETPDARRERLCDDFNGALKSGDFPHIDDYLLKVPEEERPDLLAELVREEHVSRRERKRA
jgi:hypothetical protein